jgi:hypothetical protein
MTRAIGTVIALVLLVAGVGCGAASSIAAEGGAPDAAVTAEHPPDSSDGPRETADADASEDAPDGADAADGGPACCPIDTSHSGCTNLGGADRHGCYITCDFYCSTNWRVETDDGGCPLWKYDIRKPNPGENDLCWTDFDARDASSEDAG